MVSYEIPDGLLARCAGQPAVCKLVVSKYVEQMQGDVDELLQICEAGNSEAVSKLAHRIKGASSNVAAEALQNHAFEIEKLAAANKLDDARELVAELQSHWTDYKTLTAKFLSQA